MRNTLFLTALLIAGAGQLSSAAPATQPAAPASTAKPAPARYTSDGAELPAVVGADTTFEGKHEACALLGKAPDKVFKQILSTAQSPSNYKRFLPGAKIEEPYYVMNQLGATAVGFDLMYGRVSKVVLYYGDSSKRDVSKVTGFTNNADLFWKETYPVMYGLNNYTTKTGSLMLWVKPNVMHAKYLHGLTEEERSHISAGRAVSGMSDRAGRLASPWGTVTTDGTQITWTQLAWQNKGIGKDTATDTWIESWTLVPDKDRAQILTIKDGKVTAVKQRGGR